MNKKHLLIIIGIVLISYAIYSLLSIDRISNPDPLFSNNLVDQEGFTPILASEEEIDSESSFNAEEFIENRPSQIIIPKINLNAPVEIAKAVRQEINNMEYIQFLVPEKFATGWHQNSAPLGEIGNTVISGHHNAYGEVFSDLDKLEFGDTINLYSGEKLFPYTITNTMILKERDEPLEVRLENARWIFPSMDERITLVTCWPHDSNTHRLIIVAIPKRSQKLIEDEEQLSSDSCRAIDEWRHKNIFFEDYVVIKHITENPTEFNLSNYDQIFELGLINNHLKQYENNQCGSLINSNLINYLEAKSLYVSFMQNGIEDETMNNIKILANSFETILQNGFSDQFYMDVFRRQSFLEQRFIPNPNRYFENIVAINKEDETLNIRRYARSNSTFLGSLKSSEETIVLGKSLDNIWLLIPYRDTYGWINSDHVRLNIPLTYIPTIPNQIIDQE